MNEIFMIKDGEWQVKIGDTVLPTIWNSRGAALAGLQVEVRRIEARARKRELPNPGINNGFWDLPASDRAARMQAAADRAGVDDFFDLPPDERLRAYED